MLMPIVSMNKMAMNESVATTCCYRLVATPTAQYWEVLNGGWIGSGYVETLAKKAPYGSIDSSWYDFKYDLVGSEDNIKTVMNNGFIKYTNDNWWWFDKSGNNVNSETLSSKMAGWGIQTSKTCDHETNSDCIYRETKIEFLNNRHFESKTKHDKGGSSWAKPHEAKQFSS